MNFMETKDSYRHLIGKKEKELVIKELIYVIKNKKIDVSKFSFIGIIGSHMKEYSHDIDVLIFPSKNSKIGESLIELGNLYEQLEKRIKKHNKQYYVSACPRKVMQEMTYYLSSLQEGSAGIIPIHSLFFTNSVDFKKFNPVSFQKTIQKDMLVLHGRFDAINTLPRLPEKKLEPYFFIRDFEMMSRISTYPRHLVRASAESMLLYLHEKYKLNLPTNIPHDVQGIKKTIIKAIRDIDDVVYGQA